MEQRHGTLVEENDTIFSNFSKVVDSDGVSKKLMNLNASLYLSKKDLEVINC